MMNTLTQKVIKGKFVKCPHCDELVELSWDKGVSVDSPHIPNLTFCSWKCLGRWVIEVYEQGKQFEYKLEVK